MGNVKAKSIESLFQHQTVSVLWVAKRLSLKTAWGKNKNEGE
jgi:hypothetical protein